jgi:hypothetical protein
MDFPWPGDGGQGKVPPPSGASLSWKNPAGLHRLPQRNCPKGCVLLPDRRLPIGQKKVYSVLSVPLWLTKINDPCDYSLQCVPMICLLLQTSDPHN